MKHYNGYRIYHWPVGEKDGKLVYVYNPQYWDDEAEKWRPCTTEDEKHKQVPRLYPTRMEAEQWIEVQLYAKKKQRKRG